VSRPEPAPREAAADDRDWYEEITGSSLTKCPACHHGSMLVIEVIKPIKTMPANPRRLVTESCGALQVMLCAVVLAGAAILLGYSRITAVVIGLTLAMSSTAVVIQVLSEEKRLNTVAGNASSAILLFRASTEGGRGRRRLLAPRHRPAHLRAAL
jgi:hypothetical protein